MNPDDILPKHVTAPVTHPPSPQQEVIYQAARESDRNIQIEAVAGSGKSTTIIALSNQSNNESYFLAFNKAIAQELGPKLPRSRVKTLNGLGHGVLMRYRPKAKLNGYKSFDWLRQNMSPELYEGVAKDVVRVVSVAKGQGLGIMKPYELRDFRALVDSYCQELEPGLQGSVAQIGMEAFKNLTVPSETFDFDDQLYWPVKEGWQFPATGTTYVDECQDLNPIQHMMLARLGDRGSRIISVGDRRQAIYGWRGSLSNSMDLLRDTFVMQEFPLSVTYRCSRAVTALAQTIVPEIQHRPDAPEGAVEHLYSYPEVKDYSDSDLIICRNNGPIFSLALQFIRAKRPVRIMSNFLEEFDKFVSSFKATSIPLLLARAEEWFVKNKKDCEERGAWGKLEGIRDKYETLKAFAPEFETIQAMMQAINRLATGTVGPLISTIHRSKGLEANTVYLLRWDLLPSPRAVSEEAIKQEDNLRYVAITRAKQVLRILPLGG